VHNWADLQSVHGFRCYDNIMSNAKCQQVLVLAVCLVYYVYLNDVECKVINNKTLLIIKKYMLWLPHWLDE